jgi:hypothetical protein
MMKNSGRLFLAIGFVWLSVLSAVAELGDAALQQFLIAQ